MKHVLCNPTPQENGIYANLHSVAPGSLKTWTKDRIGSIFSTRTQTSRTCPRQRKRNKFFYYRATIMYGRVLSAGICRDIKGWVENPKGQNVS